VHCRRAWANAAVTNSVNELWGCLCRFIRDFHQQTARPTRPAPPLCCSCEMPMICTLRHWHGWHDDIVCFPGDCSTQLGRSMVCLGFRGQASSQWVRVLGELEPLHPKLLSADGQATPAGFPFCSSREIPMICTLRHLLGWHGNIVCFPGDCSTLLCRIMVCLGFRGQASSPVTDRITGQLPGPWSSVQARWQPIPPAYAHRPVYRRRRHRSGTTAASARSTCRARLGSL
jgi:hypothetical protein